MSKRRRTHQAGSYPLLKAAEKLPANTRQIADDQLYGEYITPPYAPNEMLKIVEESDILKPLITAMAVNTALFGWGIRYKATFDFNEADQTVQAQATAEWQTLERIYQYFNPMQSFSQILYKACMDKETIGWGCIEIIRDLSGKIAGGEYARACNFRLAPQKPQDRISFVKQLRLLPDGQTEEIETPRCFKKFVQVHNGARVYFKEFGDPRPMNWQTGEYGETEAALLATEIVFLHHHSAYSDYGTPRWSGNIPAVMGSRNSEELNLNYFAQGRMLPFAILVSGGQLTEESLEVLRTGKGLDNAYKVLVLEALPDDSAALNPVEQDKPRVDLKMEHLTDTNLSDGLFMEYQRNNREKIRGAFRLPPMYLGDSADYTRATAEVAKMAAEEQIFIPERDEIANVFNAVIGNELGLRYCEMYLKGPEIGDMTELAQALTPFVAAGAATPNMLIDALGKLLGKDLEVVLPDELGNVPIEILKLQTQQAAVNSGEMQSVQKTAEVQTLKGVANVIHGYLGDNHAKL